MNKFIFTGNLGTDAEVKYLPNGGAVCEFSAAAKAGYGDKETTLWLRCSMFGKKAEGQLPGYLQKGTKVCISGELSMDEWEKDGVKNKMLKLRVEDLDLIGSKQEGQQAPQQNHQQPQQQAPQGYPQPQQGYAPQQPQQPQSPQNAAYVQPMQQPNQPMQQAPAVGAQSPQPANSFDNFDDDIPF